LNGAKKSVRYFSAKKKREFVQLTIQLWFGGTAKTGGVVNQRVGKPKYSG